jgi:hypothetical protein
VKAKEGITSGMMGAVAAGLILAARGQADPGPLKVFILAGQSNMEGPAIVDAFQSRGQTTS